jgi:hypothetical protein
VKGLSVGEQSSSSNPVLQLFVRSGEFLADLDAGTFKVESIRDPGEAPSALVAETPFDSSHKLGTGRYVIPTGDTATWKPGTHRAICTYTIESGGPSYTQVIEFEVLDPVDWPTGAAYVGYVSTRRIYTAGYANYPDISHQKLHFIICESSRQVEHWTRRWFEPRYLTLKVDGSESPVLLLESPIIAIEDIYAVWKNNQGVTDEYKYEQYLYKVFNRHLHGFTEADDRKNPRIELTSVDGTVVKVSTFAWPYGSQNIQISGVFGYTEPDLDPSAGQVAIGTPPMDLVRILGALTSRQVKDPSMTNLLTWTPGAVRSMRTRDQSVSFGGSGGGSAGGAGGAAELSGDPLIDSILIKYCAPTAVGGF